MIPYDFDYYKPKTYQDAIKTFQDLKTSGKKAIYLGGGTEFITMSRLHNLYADAVIDIKSIPECNIYEINGDELVIGAGLSLTHIVEINIFPLLSQTIKRIADHTIQGKITLGGNLMGSVIYKESSLPLLVSNSEIVVGNPYGLKREGFNEYWEKDISEKEGDLILQIIVKTKYIDLPYVHVKRTKNEKIDYPLISAVALKDGRNINIAFSGLCDFPFRSKEMEQVINKGFSKKINMDRLVEAVPYQIQDNLIGSLEFRKFVLARITEEIVEKLEGGNLSA